MSLTYPRTNPPFLATDTNGEFKPTAETHDTPPEPRPPSAYLRIRPPVHPFPLIVGDDPRQYRLTIAQFHLANNAGRVRAATAIHADNQ